MTAIKGMDLFNGNIRSIMSKNTAFAQQSKMYSYVYDRLNRLKGMKGYDKRGSTWNPIITDGSDNFMTHYSYDPNGNILSLDRWAQLDETNDEMTQIDKLEYNYYGNKNPLQSIYDEIGANVYEGDLDHQNNNNNYVYYESGFLIADLKEGITNILWNAAGKVVEVHKDGALYISFKYDAYGNRLMKEVAGGDKTLYIRDLQGNIMATYTYPLQVEGDEEQDFNLQEHHIYGSSRLGIVKAMPENTTENH